MRKYQYYRIHTELEAKRNAVLRTTPEHHQVLVKTLLDNQITSLMSLTTMGKQVSTEEMHVIVDSAINTIGAYQILSDIVGVQPLTGPVGLASALQLGDNPNGITIDFKSIPIKASSYKCTTTMPLYPITDISTSHGIDIKKKIATTLGYELGQEIVTNVITKLVELAIETTIDYLQTEEGNISKLAFIEFNKASADIVIKTCRGAGNFLIMSPETFSKISMDPAIKWVPAKMEKTLDTYGLTPAGEFGDKYSVYLSRDAAFNTGKVLVGYLGKHFIKTTKVSGSVDTGVILAPYIPIVSTGVLVDPNTYEPVQGFITRYGMMENTIENSNQKLKQNAENYYRMVDISKLLAQ